MITIKTPKDRFFATYLTWLNPVLHLSKGEIDILSSLMTLHYAHRHYDPEILNDLIFNEKTYEAIRKKMKINSKLFNKLLASLRDRGLIEGNEINPKLTNYPKDNKFRLFVAFEPEK